MTTPKSLPAILFVAGVEFFQLQTILAWLRLRELDSMSGAKMQWSIHGILVASLCVTWWCTFSRAEVASLFSLAQWSLVI
ncbi:MAG: hypothetical protein GDYSWBUE_001507 [Candidatus Fervidibacterota bacterium]